MSWLAAAVAHLVCAPPAKVSYLGWIAFRFGPNGGLVSDVPIDEADFCFMLSVQMHYHDNPDCTAIVEHGAPRSAAVQDGNLAAKDGIAEIFAPKPAEWTNSALAGRAAQSIP